MLDRRERLCAAWPPAIQLGKAPEPAPDTRRRSLLDEDRAVPAQDEPGRLALWQLAPWPRRRNLVDASRLFRLADVRHGTRTAARIGTRADRGAEIHQRLRIALDIAARQQR